MRSSRRALTTTGNVEDQVMLWQEPEADTSNAKFWQLELPEGVHYTCGHQHISAGLYA